MVTKNKSAISYEGNTLKITMPITSKGQKSKNGNIVTNYNANGSLDVPSIKSSVALDSKYVEGADPNREYFVIAGVWSKEKVEKANPKKKGKKGKQSILEVPETTTTTPTISAEQLKMVEAMRYLEEKGIKFGN